MDKNTQLPFFKVLWYKLMKHEPRASAVVFAIIWHILMVTLVTLIFYHFYGIDSALAACFISGIPGFIVTLLLAAGVKEAMIWYNEENKKTINEIIEEEERKERERKEKEEEFRDWYKKTQEEYNYLPDLPEEMEIL